ncbi:hypothetical protein LTR66_007222 [Elasticomyces elasticus]|nr:hypothetical protein LTR66_007222 [Elasticomyces elasticus]
MLARKEEKPWDFSQVLGLINTLSVKDSTASQQSGTVGPTPAKEEPSLATLRDKASEEESTSLGNFNKIWQYLGTQLDTPGSDVPAPKATASFDSLLYEKTEYASDGAMYCPPGARPSKSLQWRDEVSGEDIADVVSDREAPDTPSLTKNQRKNQRKNHRRRFRKQYEIMHGAKAVSELESGAEDQLPYRTPARKASAHFLSRDLSPSSSYYNTRPRDAAGQALTAPTTPASGPPKSWVSSDSADFFHGAEEGKKKVLEAQKAIQHVTPRPGNITGGIRQQSLPSSVPSVPLTTSGPDPSTKLKFDKHQPFAQPYSVQYVPLTPSSVQPPKHSVAQPFPLKQTTHNTQSHQKTPTTPVSHHVRHPRTIEPKTVRSGADRHWALLLKLISDFYEDREHLVKPANVVNHAKSPLGIHVFVDASNIFIGFTNELKRARAIPQYVTVDPVSMSFDGLALLMERRRPIAKRVLVGSLPHEPAFDVAKSVGYECNILDKVYKAREITDRQRYFMERGMARNHTKSNHKQSCLRSGGTANTTNATTNGNTSSGSDDPPTTTPATPQYHPEKWVEQGVDEILHLKILESVVDVETPTTIVLATGDAAQAEYSDGFFVMVERALKKGWRVELVSWTANISSMYTRHAFREKWGDKFRVVLLDDYAEELLEM